MCENRNKQDFKLPRDAELEQAAGAYSAKLLIFGIAIALSVVALLLALLASGPFLTVWFLVKQDLLLLYLAAFLSFHAFRRLTPSDASLNATRRHVAGFALFIVLVGWAGRVWLLGRHEMSRDEQMARFDAMIFAQGHLVEPLSSFWHGNATALNTSFMFVQPDSVAWVSNYLPINAALQALLGTALTADLASPLLAAFGIVMLWRCVKQLWPGDKEALAIALFLYALSGQVLVTSMTSYAMTAHLALNLAWLALLLRGDKRGDLGALVVGFMATGLHQPLPHPLFAIPLLLAVAFRDRRRGGIFFLGYCAIGAFWLWWPHLIAPMVENAGSRLAEQEAGFLMRLQEVFAVRENLGVYEMTANLLRFAAWQPVVLLPLALIGLTNCWKNWVVRGLVGGVGVTLAVMAILLPYQGHGFGYRYLHGLIGNVVLLAVYGWKNIGPVARFLRPGLTRIMWLTLLLLLPLQSWYAYSFYAPYAEARARLLAMDTDYAVVSMSAVPFATDLVNNPPKLDQRPILLLQQKLEQPGFLARLCQGGASVTVAGSNVLSPIADYYNWLIRPEEKAAGQQSQNALATAGCRVVR